MKTSRMRSPHVPNLIASAALSAALAVPAAQAAPGDPLAPPITLATGVTEGRVARARDGTMVATQTSAGRFAVQRLAANGTPLAAPITIFVDAPDDVAGGASIDADGDFVVAWAHPDGAQLHILARRYAADSRVLGPTLAVATLSNFGILLADGQLGYLTTTLTHLSVDMNASGEFAVLWSVDHDGLLGNRIACGNVPLFLCLGKSDETLSLRRYDRNGTAQGLPRKVAGIAEAEILSARLLDVDIGGAFTGADVEVRADGSTVVAWSDARFSNTQRQSRLYTRTYTAKGDAQPTRELGNAAGVEYAGVQLDSADDGRYVVAHGAIADDPVTFLENCSIHLDRLAADGAALAPRTRVDVPGPEPCAARQPDVAVDAAGNLVVTWERSSQGVFQRYAASGVALGGNVDIEGAFPVTRRLTVGSDAAGDFAVAYSLSRIGLDDRKFLLNLYDGP